ncbi:unnamed protein product [Adineta ricciae]|uniref:G-protein coupled receptors family 1 profile domain-containing protein n=1 Tax=Adineta ricciae TaxID=249248 RepID=A0A815L7K9_ADIRI|nr:unnamed protein product [Adineta ricciae]
MSKNETSSNDTDYDYDYQDGSEVFIPSAAIQFWTYLILQIPSLFCTIFLLYYLIFDRRLRQQIHNHVIIVLLFLSLFILAIDNSFYLDGWRLGHGNMRLSTPSFCLLWWFIDYGFYGAVSVFLVWASLERHILIFHRRQLLGTQRKVFYVHYLPLILLSVYLLGFYIGVLVFPPCQNVFYFNYIACGSSPCYQEVPWLNTWDYFVNGILCNILEAIFSVSLLGRTVWKKCYAQSRFQWRKYRKMTIQLLSISTLSLCINLPQSLITLIQQIHPDLHDFGSSVEPYFFYLTGYVILLLPFVSLGCLPELWSRLLCWSQRGRRMVGPMTITAGGGQTVFVRTKHY